MAELRAQAGVTWAKPTFAIGENLSARIAAHDGNNSPANRIVWTLYRNGYQVHTGEGASFSYITAVIGLYRLKGTAYFNLDAPVQFDSMAYVQGAINVRHSLPVPEPGGTMVYLGAVFTQNIAASGGQAASLPYKLASATEDIYLLPGTTHWSFDLDPDSGTVDDEVVVRTAKGNWALNGLGGGLSGEGIGYDYGYMPIYIPAPIDHRIKLTAEMFKVNGNVYNGFNTRVRIRCYRNLASGIYRYDRCAGSRHPGGVGRRMRRWAALFTNINIQANVFNVLGVSHGIVSYNTVDTTSVPLMRMSTSGSPNPVPGFSGLFYTDSNLYAYYESDGSSNIAAHAISAIESVRPCCVSFLYFNNGKPIISNRIKRVYGKLTIFLTDGAVFTGSTVTVKIYKTDGLTHTDYTVPIANSCYVNEDDTIQKVGEVAIDLSDYQFDETGIVIDFEVVEPERFGDWELETGDGRWELEDMSGVWSLEGDEEAPIPVDAAPNPATGPDFIYSPLYAHTVSFDGACYTNPTFQAVFDDNAVMLDLIGGCQDPVCGPNALYCYTALNAPAENVILPQPFGRPAPYISYGTNPARCFYNPIALTETSGTQVSTLEFFGSMPVDLWSFSGTALCGAAFQYTDCQAVYAPCPAYACSIIVVYPISSSPHPSIAYGGRCYYYSGSTTDYGTRTAVAVADVDPISDCLDPICSQFNATGSVVVYNDTQTMLEVPVRFNDLDRGTPYYGVAIEVMDSGLGGLTAGSKQVVFREKPDVFVYMATGSGQMQFQFNLSGIPKRLVVVRGGIQSAYDPGIGGTRYTLLLQTGDRVFLRIADAYGRLPFFHHDRAVNVSWHPFIQLPRLYDTAIIGYSGTSTINALGFCSYTNEGVYTFYGSLPVNGSMTGPVNPDSWVTVAGADGQEYNLISMKSVGDLNIFPVGQPWYNGQSLAGPFTFKFYAARQQAGAHGEMDVWFNTDGTFPSFLRAGRFEAMELNGTFTYRKDSTPFDTIRNSYKVATQVQVSEAVYPNVYVSEDDGQVISSVASSTAIERNTASYAKLSADPGISYDVLAASDIEIVWGHISDFGFDYPQQLVLSNLVHSWNPDFIISAGDDWQSGSTNSLASLDNKVGVYYHDFIYPYIGVYGAVATEQRFFTCVGNHDYTPAGTGPIVPATYRLPMYQQYFNQPSLQYDVLKWPVHFFFLDNTEYMIGSETQDGAIAQWLRGALAASSAPWKVVILHYTPWSSGTGHIQYLTRRWPFKEWGADIVFSGHTHVYERFQHANGLVTIDSATCNPQYWFQPSPAGIWLPAPITGSVYGYGIAPQVPATSRCSATSKRLTVEYTNVVGTVLDSVTLTKG